MADPTPSDDPTKSPRRAGLLWRVARWLAVPFLLALLLNIGIALILSCAGAPVEGVVTTASEGVDDSSWTVTRTEKAGATLVVSELGGGVGLSQSWSASQVCGPPNTPTLGDLGTAWASSTQDGQVEWLELSYAKAVVPKSVRVYESYNPGSLVKVVVYREGDTTPVQVWQGTDPTSPSSTTVGFSEVPISVDFPVKRLRIYLDSPKFAGWNEIDAVGLVDQQGQIQWATKCRASSVYGRGSYVSGSPQPAELLPAGIGFTKDPETPGVESAAGFGWPMRCLWTPIQRSAPSPPFVYPTYTLGTVYSGPVTSSGSTTLPGSFTTTVSPSMSGGAGSGVITGSSTGATLITKSGSGTIVFPGSTPKSAAVLPYRPAWGALSINTLIYVPAIVLLRWLLVVPIRFIREVARIRRGGCMRCGYNLGYDFVPGCPECGWRREHAAERTV